MRYSQEKKELEKELEQTKAQLREEEAKDIEEMDCGRLGWLKNHLEVLENRLNGTLKGDNFNYEILQ